MKGLLSVSFGTSHADTRMRTIDAIDADLAAAFPDRAFYSAWTSTRIVKKIRSERGEHHDTIEEAFARLTADGVDDLVVATMCLMQGGEMRKITDAVDVWVAAGHGRARLAAPLMASEQDRLAIAEAIRDEFADLPADDALLLMGHGSAHAPNGVYAAIQRDLHALGCDRVFVATVEGTPTFDDVVGDVLAANPACVHLAPLMVVAGDHAKNDLAGPDDSWASELMARGLRTNPVLKGLGEYPAIRKLACDHAREARER